MAYNITYIFGDSLTTGFNHPAGRILITMVITVNKEGTDQTYLAKDYGIHVHKYGRTSLETDLDEFLMDPNEYTFKLMDENDTLKTLMFTSVDSPLVGKNFYVKLEVKHNGDSVYTNEFSGENDPKLIDYNDATKVYQFTAYPSTKILNSTSLFRESGGFINPLNLEYSMVGVGAKARSWNTVNVVDLITKIYQVINKDITIEFKHNWQFAGYHSSLGWKYDFTFSELILTSNWIGTVFDSDKFGLSNLGDVLKQIAFEYGCVAGMLNEDEAFFKQILYFDENDTQSLGTIISHRRKFKYNNVDWTYIKNALYHQDDSEANKYVVATDPSFGSLIQSWGWAPIDVVEGGFLDKREGANGLSETVITFFDVYDYNVSDPLSESNILVPYPIGGGEYENKKIYGVKHDEMVIEGPDTIYDGSGNNFNRYSVFLAYYWYLMKARIANLEIGEFRVKGLNYNYTKGFVHEGGNFSIIGMVKDWDAINTKIEAIEVKQNEFTYDTSLPTGQQPPSESTLNVSVKYSAAMKSILSIDSVGVTTAIGTIKANDEIFKEITVVIQTGFTIGSIASLRVFDSSGDLLTDADLLLTSTNIVRVPIMKEYSSDETIYIEVVAGSEAPVAGTGMVVIEKLKKEE